MIIVGWGWGATYTWYPSSATNTRTVGAQIDIVANNLKAQTGLKTDNIWCIGHSLGAHTCGFAGMRTKIGRITGRMLRLFLTIVSDLLLSYELKYLSLIS